MPVYYIILAGLSVLGLGLCWKKRSRTKDAIFLLVSFIVLAGISAVRYDVGVDYSYGYGPFYESFLADPTGYPTFGGYFEPGFMLLCRIIASFSQNYQTLFVVTSILIIALILLYYWLYSPNVFISVFLFIALSQYYCSMNFLRQTLAAAIALYALPLLKKRTEYSILGYLLVVLVAASFHKSALILIPFFFINAMPINKYVFVLYSAVTALVYVNTHQIVEFVTKYWYSGYGLDSVHMLATFEFPFTLALGVVFLILFLGVKKLQEVDPRNILHVSYAFFALFFALMGTRHSILDRLALYFELAAPVGIAIIVNQMSKALAASEQKKKLNIAAFVSILVVIFGGGLAIHEYALIKDYHDVLPYQTVYQQPFYKDYVNGLKENRDVDIIVEPDEPDDLLDDQPDDPEEIDPSDIQSLNDEPEDVSQD